MPPAKFCPGDVIVPVCDVIVYHDYEFQASDRSEYYLEKDTSKTFLTIGSNPCLVLATDVRGTGKFYALVLTSEGKIGTVYAAHMRSL